MKANIQVQNLKCHGCATTIKNKLVGIEDISDLNIDAETKTVSFSYSNTDTINEVKQVLASAGYPEEGDKNVLTTKAKSFVSCAMGKMNA
ncbi:heavy-metal-associated domain-containing protein [Tamlana fucoidanivorans]|uniref:Heavy-metal-associated domain-containing protein n=1 Tax=Allotamlana fucoidanivorans TaxID=2583814 RepID=A0A5C4SP47_9FLAO|nr:heavy metal-associated domain-containing protein [Tamlana fucoidanivorans]TNJ45650.1 heavy-metal-associated domain-containing protein [Tamlana fucoidanivorans]